ncbi:MAG: helix-turn-helix transcriptional regulator [Lachnospiraceae bacterium]|nr:helix-turn-helix transcriptional regulator [Lachnospiraceae bacterium]
MDQEKIGVFIQTLRKEKGLTQKELAEQVGVSDKTISKWENGNGIPDTMSLPLLCESLGVRVSELLAGETLPLEVYSEKTEETIVNLLKEGEHMRKGRWVHLVLGIIALALGFSMIFMDSFMGGMSAGWFYDPVTIISMLLICVAGVLLTGAWKKRVVISTLRKIVLPAGAIISVVNTMNVLNNLLLESDGTQLKLMLTSCTLLPLLYAFILYLLLVVMEIFREIR